MAVDFELVVSSKVYKLIKSYKMFTLKLFLDL